MIKEKVRLRFSKLDRARFLSHHDLMRIFARSLRRAQTPVRMTEGFNPRPRIVFAQALPLGESSADEIVEVELSDWLRPKEMIGRLNGVLPAGLKILSADLVPPKRAGAAVRCAAYEVAGFPPGEDFSPRVADILSRREMLVERLRKGNRQTADIRPGILSLRWDSGKLHMELAAGEGGGKGSPRPEELARHVLGRDPESPFEVLKTKTVLA